MCIFSALFLWPVSAHWGFLAYRCSYAICKSKLSKRQLSRRVAGCQIGARTNSYIEAMVDEIYWAIYENAMLLPEHGR